MRRTGGVIANLVAGAGALLLMAAPAGAADAVVVAAGAELLQEAVEPVVAALTSNVIVVEEGEDTLHDAVEAAAPGDTLVLEPGLYVLTHTVLIDKDLTIRGATRDRKDVHIIGAEADEFDLADLPAELFANPLNWGHLLFVTDEAEKVSFRYFTIKNAPEIEAITEDDCEAAFGLNHSECMGDAIHTDGVAEVEVEHVEASLNGGNGVWVRGAQQATLRDILGVNNGAFGIDVDSALDLSIRRSTFIANQVSGIEVSGHDRPEPPLPDLTRDQYVAKVSIKDTVAKGNGEIGIEVERFRKAKIEDITCADNREDGFDADRVSELELEDGKFINNGSDGVELFPVNVADPAEQPADFPGSIILRLDDLDFAGNVGEEINFAPTEN